MKKTFLKIAATALAVAGLGCAEIGRPPGGPIDTTPPAITGAFPESLAVNVDRLAPITIAFSEKVDKNTVRDWFFIRPHRRIEDIGWEGSTASFTFRDGLPADSTITYIVGSGILDRDANRIAGPFRRTFSTGASVAPGRIAGQIKRTRIGVAETGKAAPPPATTSTPGRTVGPAAFIWLYKALADTLPDPAEVEPDFLTEADPTGRFMIEGLPLNLPLLVIALNDGDRSRSYTESRDFFTVQADTLRLTDAAPEIAAMTFFLIDPNAPGVISGSLMAPADTSVVDTLAYGVILSAMPEEGTEAGWPPVKTEAAVTADAKGNFKLTRIPPGAYRIAVYVDLDEDGRWSLTDRLGPPAPVMVKPEEETGGIVLPRP